MPWTPADLSPVAWYDVDSSTSTTAVTDSSGNARADLAFGSGSNSPVYLDYSTVGPGVRLAGSSNSRISSASTSLFASAGAIDVRQAMLLPVWGSPASTVMVATCGNNASSAANYAFEWTVQTSGTLRLTVSSGSATATGTSSVVTGITDGTLHGVRVTWDGTTAKFFLKAVTAATAMADIKDNSGWSQLGTDRPLSNTLSATAFAVGIGSRPGGLINAPDGASVHAFCAATAIDGTPVIEFDAAACAQTGYTDSVSSLAWTVVRPPSGRKSVVLSPAATSTRDVVLAGSDDWLDGPTASVPAATSSDSCTLAAMIRPWATQAAGKVVATTRATTTAKGVSIEMAGTASVRAVISDGTTTVTSASVSLTLGERALVGVILTNGSPGTARVFVVNRAGVTLGATSGRTGNDETGGDLRCFADQSGGNVMDVQSEAPWMSWDSALSSADLLRIFDYYDNSAHAESASATAEAYQAATNVESGPGTAAATAAALDAGASVTAPAEVAAGVTAAAYNAVGYVYAYAETATVTAAALGAGSTVATTAPTATVTAAALGPAPSVAALATTATVTATASAPTPSVSAIATVAAVVAAAYNALADAVTTKALRITFAERTRATFRERRQP